MLIVTGWAHKYFELVCPHKPICLSVYLCHVVCVAITSKTPGLAREA